MQKVVYVDNAATTKISSKVLEVMMPYLTEFYGNPSSIYSVGRDAKKAIETARDKVAAALGCENSEIYFMGSGTEADNYAIKSVMEKLSKKGKNHIITTNFEHHAVLHTCEYMQKHGFDVTYLPVDENGYVTATQVSDAITDKTGLVTIMYANNEIGTIQPISEIGKVCKD
ncbi:MAG: cysteine desulfurase family protein, partial [Anaerotignaceae bacterium]